MKNPAIYKILGVLLILFSTSMLPPIVVSLVTKDGAAHTFFGAFILILALGVTFWLPTRKCKSDLRFRDGFFIVVLFWVVLGLMASIPLILLEDPVISLVDAVFESMSGLTTTGATILTSIDDLAPSILYYRQQLQWFGGMGIIVLAVAVMPMLGIGGMQLYRAETPGPVKDNKLTPRITETAKALWYIYLGLTVACAFAYYLAGMTPFDALSHAFSTIAIGGFSTHDASLGHFQSVKINAVATVFMFLAALNFGLHFVAFRSKSLKAYFNDPEARVYTFILLGTSAVAVMMLYIYDSFSNISETVIHGITQVVSVVTTTGFTTTNFALWPTFLPVLLILLSTIGGCAGSTAGGMKVIRCMLLYKQGSREIQKLVHPNAMIPIKIGKKPVNDNIINAVWGFLSLYIMSYVILLIALLATGVDFVTAFSAVTACLSNLGPGLGEVAQNYSSISDFGKGVLAFAMLLGRLELFTLLVMFSRTFWKG